MNYISRQLESLFLDATTAFKAVLVTGSRQVGKSTMLKHLAEGTNRTYVSLDNDSDRSLAKSDPALFFQMYKPPMIIDEVQKAPELFNTIKRICDESEENGLFWITGSEQFKLIKNISETLSGRLGILHLYGFTTRELKGLKNNTITVNIDALRERASATNDIVELYERIWKGSYPGVQDIKDSMRTVFYDSYIDTYLMRDVLEDTGVTDWWKFHKFIVACAAINGNLLNYATLADSADISQPTAKSWIGILEALGVVFLLPPFSNNRLKALVKTPKLYFWDTGLCAHLCRWQTADTLMNGASSGSFLETYVITELIKSHRNCGGQVDFSFYRDRQGREVDLVVKKGQEVTLIEVKRTASPDKSMAKNFSAVKVNPPEVLGPGAIFCSVDKVRLLAENLLAVPIGLI